MKPPPQPSVDTRAVEQAIAEGDIYFKREMFDDAIAAYDQGLRADPNTPKLQPKLKAARTAKRILSR